MYTKNKGLYLSSLFSCVNISQNLINLNYHKIIKFLMNFYWVLMTILLKISMSTDSSCFIRIFFLKPFIIILRKFYMHIINLLCISLLKKSKKNLKSNNLYGFFDFRYLSFVAESRYLTMTKNFWIPKF